MAMSTTTMDSYDPEPSEQWHLARKLFLLLLLVTAIALGFAILFRQRINIPLQFFNILADICIGLILGIGSRIFLNQRNGFIRAITCAALSIIGLAVLGYFTGGKSGFDVVQYGRRELDWSGLVRAISVADWKNVFGSFQFNHVQMDWLIPAHMLIAIDTSWIAMRAWKKIPRFLEQSSSSAAPRANNQSRARASQASVRTNGAAPRIRISGASGAAPKVRRKPSGRAMLEKASARALASAKSSRSRKWNPLRRKPEVQLAVYEEHRCPFCFEPVKRDDPRGVVECEVCHTLHHKDCWDVTGACQVPHLNT